MLSSTEKNWVQSLVRDTMPGYFPPTLSSSADFLAIREKARDNIKRKIRLRFRRSGAFGSIISSILISLAIRFALKLIEKWIRENTNVF